jgi:hypothetical protein
MAEQTFVDNTKKASTRIFKELEKINPKISPKTTYQQAFEILMTEWDLELSVESTVTSTTCNIYKDNVVAYTFNWSRKESYNEREADWDWNFIYKNVLEHIAKTRMYKRPKISKSELRRIEKEKAEAAKAAAKQAKLDEKAAKIKAKEDAKKAKELAKQAKEDAKAAKELAKANKASKRGKKS